MNKFGLIYKDAINENLLNEVNIKHVKYELSGIEVSGNLYLPPNLMKLINILQLLLLIQMVE